MASKYWIGTADAVAQLETGSIDTVDGTPSNNTFAVTIGGDTVSVVGDTDVATTAGNLVTQLNLSTNPYFSAITWANPSGGTITGTADVAGVPFEASLTVSGAGTGTVTDFATTTANAGPNDWGTAENWSDGVVPVSSDSVTIANNSVNIIYGLDQNAVTLAELVIKKSFTGKIGLDYKLFSTSLDGDTTNSAKTEYRETKLKIGATVVRIGDKDGFGTQSGSSRINLDLGTAVSTVTVVDTASTSSDSGRTAVRIQANNASTDIFVRNGSGGVSVAKDEPNETSTVGDVICSNIGTGAVLQIGSGVTLTNYEQSGGVCLLDSASTVTSVKCTGGTLTMEGDYTVTTLAVSGGTVRDNHEKTAGDAVSTLTVETGGTYNTQGSSKSRTINDATIDLGGILVTDTNFVTYTTINYPSERFTLSVAVQ